MAIEANGSGRFPMVVAKTAAQPGTAAAVCANEIIFVADTGKSKRLEFKCMHAHTSLGDILILSSSLSRQHC